MPGHLVGGYLAWAETVPERVLIDKQFRGLCTTAWAHSQVLLSLPDKTVRSQKVTGFSCLPGRVCHPKADAVGRMQVPKVSQTGQVFRKTLSSLCPVVLFTWHL